MPFGFRAPVRRAGPDRYRVDLPGDIRDLLAGLAPQLRDALSDPDDPVLRRLFPPAFSADGDAERQAEYVRLMQEDLVERHGEALAVLERTATAKELTGEELDGWVRALNQLRLALGTRLDVTEDDDGDHPDPDHQLYYLLGYLQQVAVDALSGED